ncbi:ArsR/SmtB family transcription factor [Microbulbifer halophilus]|uniref:ArsR/SmtB family transcription factor n=1 Tax=Microbulbifer halophilus TaxID=453963 RepID=A0ABW5E9J2_9GAMM|nr:winged helix-turn-helix domain-containing protein [Microbulbifer halophilus]MCW8124954.1 winged helix-turn-helix domain-containing protein [Microbulbifer halophilus]
MQHRVALLEAGGNRSEGEDGLSADGGDPRFWLLAALRKRVETPGAVAFGGTVDLPDGRHYEWQWGEAVEQRLAADWSEAAAPLEALGHPVRLAILHSVLEGHSDIASLAALPQLGTRGQLYHHLKVLESGGWIQPQRRGVYGVPGERVVPLLTILAAATGG